MQSSGLVDLGSGALLVYEASGQFLEELVAETDRRLGILRDRGEIIYQDIPEIDVDMTRHYIFMIQKPGINCDYSLLFNIEVGIIDTAAELSGAKIDPAISINVDPGQYHGSVTKAVFERACRSGGIYPRFPFLVNEDMSGEDGSNNYKKVHLYLNKVCALAMAATEYEIVRNNMC